MTNYMIPTQKTILGCTQNNLEKGTIKDMTTLGEITATS